MEPSPELCELAEYFQSFTAGDRRWIDRHVLNGDELRLIGANSDEWLGGVDGFTIFRHEAAAAAGRCI